MTRDTDAPAELTAGLLNEWLTVTNWRAPVRVNVPGLGPLTLAPGAQISHDDGGIPLVTLTAQAPNTPPTPQASAGEPLGEHRMHLLARVRAGEVTARAVVASERAHSADPVTAEFELAAVRAELAARNRAYGRASDTIGALRHQLLAYQGQARVRQVTLMLESAYDRAGRDAMLRLVSGVAQHMAEPISPAQRAELAAKLAGAQAAIDAFDLGRKGGGGG
jgi:hypothetical protein